MVLWIKLNWTRLLGKSTALDLKQYWPLYHITFTSWSTIKELGLPKKKKCSFNKIFNNASYELVLSKCIHLYITLKFLHVPLVISAFFHGLSFHGKTIIFEVVFCLIRSWISYTCNKMRSVYNVSLIRIPVSSCSISACRDTTLPTHFAFYDASPDLAKSSEQICWN